MSEPKKLSREGRRVLQNKIIQLLGAAHNLTTLSSCGPEGPEVAKIVAGVKELNPAVTDAEKLISYGLSITGSHPDLERALRSLLVKVQSSKCAVWDASATHREKRAFVASLGMRGKLVDLATLAESKELQAKLGIRVIIRERNFRDMLPLQTILWDSELTEECGFERVGAEESVIYVAKLNIDGTIQYKPQLVVIRDVGSTGEKSEAVFKWASDVVGQACSERRNVRPNHGGKMVQLGWNAGPRHARVWGLAKSFTKNLSSSDMIDHDSDAIALLTLFWSQAKAHLPAEVMERIEKSFEDFNLPRIATRNVPEGLGYHFKIEGKTYSFPLFERAPPEGYMSQDYVAVVHKDKCYAWYALGWCVGREVDEGCKNPGGNFVDVSLRVVVEQAAGTLMVFEPEHPHGTTQLNGAHNRTCAITFSSHILEAYKKALAAGGLLVESGSGAGRGPGSGEGSSLT